MFQRVRLASSPLVAVVAHWMTSSEAISLALQSIGKTDRQAANRIENLAVRPATFHDRPFLPVGRTSFGILRRTEQLLQVPGDPIRFAPITLANFQRHATAVVLPSGYKAELVSIKTRVRAVLVQSERRPLQAFDRLGHRRGGSEVHHLRFKATPQPCRVYDPEVRPSRFSVDRRHRLAQGAVHRAFPVEAILQVRIGVAAAGVLA